MIISKQLCKMKRIDKTKLLIEKIIPSKNNFERSRNLFRIVWKMFKWSLQFHLNNFFCLGNDIKKLVIRILIKSREWRRKDSSLSLPVAWFVKCLFVPICDCIVHLPNIILFIFSDLLMCHWIYIRTFLNISRP